MAMGNLRREEQIGLALAVAFHAALLGLLALRPAIPPAPVPQRISVTLSPDVGLNAAAPTHEDAAADVAPTPGTPPAPAPVMSPPPATVAMPPVEKPVAVPKPVAVTRPRPLAIAPARPETTPPAKPAHRHDPSVRDWDLAAPATPDRRAPGASRIGNDFLKGVAGGKVSGKARQQGAAVIGPEVKSALAGAIAQQLKPHWLAPQGVDADQLITILAWDLNPDGTLAGPPRLVAQHGITDSNRPQAARHVEQAMRAVELGAPFKLPTEYYDAWKHVRSFEFNRTLSQ